mmetsp:Transcript_2728/g.4644  ORF Transcript_2728/g.4644 Transcript_2728/m.4644 type:complete len:416 (+) Transcript_2728:18-1265(+)
MAPLKDARKLLQPKFQLTRTLSCISLLRDGILLRITPREMKFQLDSLNDSQNPNVEQEYAEIKRAAKFTKALYGVFGYVKLKKAAYLILIEEASIVGQIIRGNVYRVDKLLFVPLYANADLAPEKEDQPFIDMLQRVQAEKAFYFSYDIDLTSNLQSTLTEIRDQTSRAPDSNAATFAIMRDAYPNSIAYLSQFAFNHSLLAEFKTLEYSPFRVPCIFGYIYVGSPLVKSGASTEYYLLSRKDCRRPGRRFVTRGLDKEGNAANFAETEHVFVHYNAKQTIDVASYVQIRGSIPLLWSMKPNLKWSPPVLLAPNFEESLAAAQTHFAATKPLYGSQYLVNLIDKKGSQKRIGDQFTRLFSELRDRALSYVWFDFHGECKKMKWENLSKLVDIVAEELQGYGHFRATLNFGFDFRS